MIVIPAIDIINGECVRLSRGDYESKKSYFKDPCEVAKRFYNEGITHLHLVDLDGAKGGEIENLRTLERICKEVDLVVDFGGGVKSLKSLESAFNAGASFCTCGSIAVTNRDEVLSWLEKYKEKLILGADCDNYKIKSNGWLNDSNIDIFDFIKSYKDEGFEYCISTDISKDGMLAGPSFSLYTQILEKVDSIKLIASGGISKCEELHKLKELGLYATIVGKAYYEGFITISEMVEAQC